MAAVRNCLTISPIDEILYIYYAIDFSLEKLFGHLKRIVDMK